MRRRRVTVDEHGLRAIPDPPGITTRDDAAGVRGTPIPRSSNTNVEHVFRDGWVCAGVDRRAARRRARGRRGTVGGMPVPRSSATATASCAASSTCVDIGPRRCATTTGSGSLIRCPYHSWLYRHDGSLAKAHGVGEPDGFDVADYSLKPVAVATWRRLRVRQRRRPEASLDLGPLAAAVDACPIEAMELVLTETNDRRFNWKVLLENYSENYHTPFVHPEIDTTAHRGLPDGQRRAGAVRLGPSAAAGPRRRRDDPGDAAAGRAGLGAAVQRPTPSVPTTSVRTSRSGRTR